MIVLYRRLWDGQVGVKARASKYCKDLCIQSKFKNWFHARVVVYLDWRWSDDVDFDFEIVFLYLYKFHLPCFSRQILSFILTILQGLFLKCSIIYLVSHILKKENYERNRSSPLLCRISFLSLQSTFLSNIREYYANQICILLFPYPINDKRL